MDLVEYEWFRDISVDVMATVPVNYLQVIAEPWFQQLFFEEVKDLSFEGFDDGRHLMVGD